MSKIYKIKLTDKQEQYFKKFYSKTEDGIRRAIEEKTFVPLNKKPIKKK